MNPNTQTHSAASTAPADILFTGCDFARAMHAPAEAMAAAGGGASGTAQPTSRHREVVVKGRRVKTIDIHAHCVIPEAMEVLGIKAAEHHQQGIVIVPEERLRAMDEQQIDVEALSINPFWYKADRDAANEVVRLNNEKLAELCGQHPDRFVAFASVALQFPELAAEQLEHAVKKLGLRGAAVGASCAGDEFSDPKFHPFWRKAEELDVLIFLHPQGTVELTKRLQGSGGLDNIIGNPLETTIALSHMIFEGTFDMFPGLKICSAHGGGYLGSYMDRSDAVMKTFPKRITVKLKKKPTEYLKQLYYDALIFTPEALRHLVANMGASQIMLGTDYPYPWEDKPVDHVMATPGLSDEERIAILGATAARLLGIKD